MAGRDVEGLAGNIGLGSGCRQQVRGHSVVDVVEVARLLTVAVDGGRSPFNIR